MPNTPKYGFPYESPPFATPSEEPGRTLHGGSSGTSEILAEKVEEELDRVDTDVQELTARVEAIENGLVVPGWTFIRSNVDISTQPNFSIDFTDGGKFAIGEFSMLRIYLRFDCSEASDLHLRLNNDSSNVYRWGQRLYDADAGNLDKVDWSTNAPSWRIGHGATVSSNNLECTIFHTNGNALHSFQSISGRQGGSATTHDWGEHHGDLTSLLSNEISSARIFTASGSFVAVWWWAEGLRVPS